MTLFERKPPMLKNVYVLLYDNLCMFEFGCVAEVFGLPRPELKQDWYQFDTFSIDDNPVTTQYAGQLSPSIKLDKIDLPATIIIPGWQGVDVKPPIELIQFIKQAHDSGSRILTICSGVFVLASSGLLNGKPATTHWRYLERLKSDHPEIQVTNDVLYVDNGQIMTSAGSAAGLDLCLNLVRQDFGADVVNSVARRLVLPPLREGNQAQFVEAPAAETRGINISEITDTIIQELDKTWSISELAERFAMSERTLLRRFKQATGTSPAKWLTQARVQHARKLLETTQLPIENLASQCGFGTATNLRQHFKAHLNIAPVAYRKQFQP